MTMTSTKLPRWTYTCVIACAILSLVSILYRYRTEKSNQAVALAVEADQVEALGASEGLSFGKTMIHLKNQGYNAVILNEEKISDLQASGLVTLRTELTREGTKVKIESDKTTIRRVIRGLSMRIPGSAIKSKIIKETGIIEVTSLNPAYISQVPVGLNPQQAKTARIVGLQIIARCSNPPGTTVETVRQTVAWIRDLGAVVFLPLGDQVLGRRDLTKEFSAALKEKGVIYASPEFTKIGGDSQMLDLDPENCVRLHSAQTLEIDKMSLDALVERYQQAAIERDVRILLVRPFTFSAEKPLGEMGELAKKLSSGLSIGTPHPFKDPGVPRLLFVLIGLSIAGSVLGLAWEWLKRDEYRYVVAGLLGLLALGCWSPSLRSYSALLGALAMPMIAFILIDERNGTKPWQEFLVVSGVSLIGGLCVSGLLNMTPYFIRAQQFSGVKVAQFAPIALVAIYFLFHYGQTKGLGKAPVVWGQIIIGVVALGALGFMMMRSGNDNPAGVSGFELHLRSLLKHIFNVRPRTKELFPGHPMMIIALGLLIRFKMAGAKDKTLGGWIALALAAGAIGQTSMVNTLCHLHTPITVGLIRIVFGIIIGGAIGLGLWAIIERMWFQTPVVAEGVLDQNNDEDDFEEEDWKQRLLDEENREEDKSEE